MHNPVSSARGTARRFAPVAVAALATAGLAIPASARADSPTLAVDATADSVVATGLPLGLTTLQVTRPDLATGAPVVIGQYQGFALPGLPFSVNTTAPTALNPAGDCWQKGDLSLPNSAGLTPDILPGDTVSVVGGPSVTVPASSGNGPGGPIAGCDKLSLWGHNAVTSAAFAANGDLTVSGQAQPLAAGVTVAATDSAGATTPAADATVGTDGSWTATIPAQSLSSLAAGPLTVAGDFAVPDVSTGATAHIGGVAFSLDKPAAAAAPAPATQAPAAKPGIALHGLRVRSHITVRDARAGKLRVSFIVPTDAKLVRIRLSHGGATTKLAIVHAAAAGTRQTLALKGGKVAKLKRGNYTVTVAAAATRPQLLASTVLRAAVRVR